MIFRKPAVHRTLLTIYGVDLYIIKKENELSDNRQAVIQMKQENVDKMVSKIINDVLRSDCSTEEGNTSRQTDSKSRRKVDRGSSQTF